MTLYKAKKSNNTGFFIQPDMIEDYAKLGYTIVKMEETEVTDVEKEMQMISDIKSSEEVNNGNE